MAAVFLFDRDGNLNVFPSTEHACMWMEAVDVLEGEYERAFLHDGSEAVPEVVAGERVTLRLRGRADAAELYRRLAQYRRCVPAAPQDESPLDFANAWLRMEWERRWPRWPGWLSVWVHGEQPEQVVTNGA